MAVEPIHPRAESIGISVAHLDEWGLSSARLSAGDEGRNREHPRSGMAHNAPRRRPKGRHHRHPSNRLEKTTGSTHNS